MMISQMALAVLTTILNQPCPAASAPVTSQPATSTAPSSTSAPAVAPAVLKILADQEAAGNKYATVRAQLNMKVVDRRVGDSEERTGWVVYQKAGKETPSRFRVHFDTLQQGAGPRRAQKLDYAFDGNWLSIAKHNVKQMHRLQVVTKGQKASPMRIGQGPLPLPFGQKASDVLEYYEAETRPVAKDEPAGTKYLKLSARKEHYRKLDVVRIEMWLNDKTHLPAKLVARDKKNKVTTAIFTKVKTNETIDTKKVFELPTPGGWTEEKKLLQK